MHEKLIDVFVENGWNLSGSVDISGDWWFQDIIQLVSNWRPNETNLYLTLLTDPQLHSKKIVWCIGISFTIPDSRHFNFIEQLTLNDMRKIDLNALARKVNNAVLNKRSS